MPKVKKKPAKKSPSRRGKAQEAGLFDRLSAIWTRFSHALIASSVLLALLGIGFLWAGGYFGMMGEQISRFAGARAVSAGFEIRRITAKGADETSEQEILTAVGPVVGTSMLHFDADRARAQVEQIGWVRSAAVSKLLPNTINISVRERVPAAVWQLSGALHLIDENGAIIREVNAYEYADLPLIVGAGAPGAASEMLQALKNEPELWGRASALIRVSDRRWNLKTKDGIDVKFPERDVGEAVHYLGRLQGELALLDEPLEYVDLRNPENFVYRIRGTAEIEKPIGRIQ
ncbi:cell division protein FtsQ/DivIB [Hyphococcus sp. DH-69]|uniref:cell division protein FtsQ/DivIB n=1 Tax=Hyphococcus formosus TaxID=3143534 RepID=UPI00398ABAE1